MTQSECFLDFSLIITIVIAPKFGKNVRHSKKMAVFFEKMAAFSKNVEAFYLKRLSVWSEKSQRFYRMNFIQELHRNALNISSYESSEAVKQL